MREGWEEICEGIKMGNGREKNAKEAKGWKE